MLSRPTGLGQVARRWPKQSCKFVGTFHLSRRVSDENRACSISIRFFKIKDPFDGRLFFNVFTRSIFWNQQKSDP